MLWFKPVVCHMILCQGTTRNTDSMLMAGANIQKRVWRIQLHFRFAAQANWLLNEAHAPWPQMRKPAWPTVTFETDFNMTSLHNEPAELCGQILKASASLLLSWDGSTHVCVMVMQCHAQSALSTCHLRPSFDCNTQSQK